MGNENKNRNMPLGFAMALAQDSSAMNIFSQLDEKKQERLLSNAKDAKTKDEMQKLVKSLSDGNFV